MSSTTVDGYYSQFLENPQEETKILTDAAMELTGKDLEKLRGRIAGKKEKEEKKEGKKPKAEGSKTSAESAEGVDLPRDFKKEQKIVDAFWLELELLDPISLVSEEVTDAFKYIGFDPDIVLREILFRGRKAGKKSEDIKKDLVDMVTVAVIKGSVTDKNLKKTSDDGKVFYKKLQETYGLSTGGAKGNDSTHLTVARVAAAVPGMVTQVLVKRPEFSKTFVGPFGSKSLPPYLRHQAAAACIPEGTSEKLKEYLLGLITAFTADQTKTLSNTKDTPDLLYDNQLNFVMTTHNSRHPSEDQRKKIFQSFSLSSDFDKLHMVAVRIKKVKTDFQTLTQQELDAELAK
jgi:hypothetical protein